jgi:hypothetical protein
LAGESSKFFTVTVTMPSDGSFRTVKPVSSRLPMVGAAPELVAAAGAGEWDGPATATAPAAATGRLLGRCPRLEPGELEKHLLVARGPADEEDLAAGRGHEV